MTRGTQFLSNSKCPCCKKQDRVSKPYGHITESRNLFLKGFCPKCNKVKSLPYRKQQLDMEGEGIKKFFKIVYNKVLKPIGSEAIKNIKKDPMKALKIGTQLGSAIASKKSICYYERWYASRKIQCFRPRGTKRRCDKNS